MILLVRQLLKAFWQTGAIFLVGVFALETLKTGFVISVLDLPAVVILVIITWLLDTLWSTDKINY